MRVFQTRINAMGQGCEGIGCHLHAQNHMEGERTGIIQPKGGSLGRRFQDDSRNSKMMAQNINSACFRPDWGSAPLIVGVMVGDRRGEEVVIAEKHYNWLVWKLSVRCLPGEVGIWVSAETYSVTEPRPPPAPILHLCSFSDFCFSLFVPFCSMVRQRLISRRGSSRGGSSRHQARRRSSSSSPPSTVDNSSYPNTRSGHGRGCGRAQGQARYPSAPFPLPQHPSPHTTFFQFRSTLSQPIITATLAISFSEEVASATQLPSLRNDIYKGETSQHGAWKSYSEDKAEEQRAQPSRKGKEVEGASHEGTEQKLETPGANQNQEGEEDTQMETGKGEREGPQPNTSDDWGCPIVEEPTTEELLSQFTNVRWHFF